MADRYSFSLTTFSPSGKLVQIEYALNAVKQGVCALGIKLANGIVLCTEKKAALPLVKLDDLHKVEMLTPNIGCTYAGMGPDFRVLMDKSRKVLHTGYKRVYNEYPSTRILVDEIAKIMQEATQSGGVRPYGVLMLVGGFNEHDSQFQLFQVDPSGAYFPWRATAIGKNAGAVKTFLEKRWSEELEIEDAIHIALLAMKESVDGELTGDNIEVGLISAPNDDQLGFSGTSLRGPRFRLLSKLEVEDRLEGL